MYEYVDALTRLPSLQSEVGAEISFVDVDARVKVKFARMHLLHEFNGYLGLRSQEWQRCAKPALWSIAATRRKYMSMRMVQCAVVQHD